MKTYTLFSNNALSSDEDDFQLSGLVVRAHDYLIAESRSASVRKSREKVGEFFFRCESVYGCVYVREEWWSFIFWNCWQPCETLKLQKSIHQWIKLSNWVKVLVHKNTHFKCNTLPRSLNYKIISHCTPKPNLSYWFWVLLQHI